jgi:hypothetical protein
MSRLHWTVRRRLQPFEDIFFEMRNRAFALVSILSEAERQRLESDFSKLTSTNCSWGIFGMKEHVEDAISFYRNRDELIGHLHSLEAELEKETDYQIQSDIKRAIDAAQRTLEAIDESLS